jgi:basic membrane protein A and related proteins
MRKIHVYACFAPLFVLFVMLFAACGSSSASSSNGQNGSGGNIATSPSAKATGSGGNTTTATTGKVTVTMVAEAGGLNNDSLNHLAYLGYSKAQQQYGFTSTVLVTTTAGEYLTDLTVAAQSANLVIAVGYFMSEPLGKVATQFPNTNFAIVNGCAILNPNTGACTTLPNVAPLSSKAVDTTVYNIIKDDESGNFTNHPSVFSAARTRQLA